MVKTLKERWNETDQRCLYCNNVTKKAVGLNKQNLKKLFSKPTLQDIIVFIMLTACLILTWSYYHDISQYKTILENPDEFCMMYSNQILLEETQNINTNNLTFTLPFLNTTKLNISITKNG